MKLSVLNENRLVKVIDKDEWSPDKDDPTEYSNDEGVIKVRSDYDIKNDPAGWMVHEIVHHKHRGEPDGPYPTGNIEKEAYVAQFKYLISKGYKSLDDILKIPTMEHKSKYYKVLQNYFKIAAGE